MDTRAGFLKEVGDRFGNLRKLPKSRSLFELASGTRLYLRYSQLHDGGRAFFGLREHDLRQLEGHSAVIALLWPSQTDPLLLPFEEYEEVFRLVQPAQDGQYKVQVYVSGTSTELYIARAGRFNVDGRFGWSTLAESTDKSQVIVPSDLTHSQVQTMLGAIGAAKGKDVWLPLADRSRIDRTLAPLLECRTEPLAGFDPVLEVLSQIDVIWFNKGSNTAESFFEVEHSTPIYSALLRFNDVHLVSSLSPHRFNVVANDARQSLFVRQLARPTFKASGLADKCSFLEYADVYLWHRRVGQPP